MTDRPPPALRCAVYTRKSSEEGLDRAFNSLDAQREACLDFVRSQRHQGWVALDEAFDDGGYSGGSVERPALRRLLALVRAGRVDAVVVYKVDRLSRSLADFARLMQLFDERRVSFVSVTQQFNTTTSMGRLTLNMLLSFAQFEREVAGERIRDKLAATFRRGVFVTGRPPIGYRRPREGEPGSAERRLLAVPGEAELVRSVYEGYLELRSPVALAARLNAAGHRTRVWAGAGGEERGGRPFTASHVHRILTNPVYAGRIAHTRRLAPGAGGARGAEAVTEVHEGLHEPIVPRALWDAVQAAMAVAARAPAGRWAGAHLLKGRLRTSEGHAMSPSSTRTRGGGPPARYYVSQKAIRHGYASCPVRSLNAGVLDDLVRALVAGHLARAAAIDLGACDAGLRDRWVRELVAGVTVAPDRVAVELADDRLAACAEAVAAARAAGPAPDVPAPACPFTPSVSARGGRTVLTLPALVRRLDGRRTLVSPDGHDLLLTAPGGRAQAHPGLARAVGRAFALRAELLRTGGAVGPAAAARGLSAARAGQLLTLTRLSPRVLRAALTAGLPPRLGVGDLLEAAQRLEWPLQEAALGLASQS